MPKGERGIFGFNIDPRAAQAASVEKRNANRDRREAILAALKVEGWTDKELAEAGARMLMATKDELKAIAQNEQLPNDLRRRAVMMINKDDDKAVALGTKIREEVFGKPRQKVDLGIEEEPPLAVIEVR